MEEAYFSLKEMFVCHLADKNMSQHEIGQQAVFVIKLLTTKEKLQRLPLGAILKFTTK
jgi:hypothetical protein